MSPQPLPLNEVKGQKARTLVRVPNLINGALDRIWTYNLPLRGRLLYPSELRGQLEGKVRFALTMIELQSIAFATWLLSHKIKDTEHCWTVSLGKEGRKFYAYYLGMLKETPAMRCKSELDCLNILHLVITFVSLSVNWGVRSWIGSRTDDGLAHVIASAGYHRHFKHGGEQFSH